MASELPSRVLLRITEGEHERLRIESRKAGLSMNDYARQQLFGREPVTPTSNYGALANRVDKVDERLAGLDDAINQVQALIAGQKGAENANRKQRK